MKTNFGNFVRTIVDLCSACPWEVCGSESTVLPPTRRLL